MKTRELSQRELRHRGLRAMARELGPVGLIRFLQDYQTGTGNYTEDRGQWLSHLKFRDISGKLRSRRKRK